MKGDARISALGDVCDVIGGGTPPKNRPEFYGGNIPWATVRDMKSDVITETEYKITTAAVQASATNIIPAGNVIIATRVGLGKICLIEQSTAINQDLRGIVPKNSNIINRYLFWWLKTVSDQIKQEGTGATVQGVKLPFIKSLKIPVPSIPEQRRIVAILHEAFEGIATAKANAEKNLQNAREVFESHLNAVFSQRGEGWVEKSLGELATLRNGINFSKSSFGETIKILGVKDFRYNYWAPIDNFDTIVSDGKIKSSDILKENDIVFVRSNGNPELIGRCLLVGVLNEKVTHSGFTIRARLRSSDINIQYLCYFLRLRETHRKMIDGGNGISIKSLSQETLSSLIIPLPRLLEKQTKIVNQVEKLSSETQHLESIYQQKLAALDELKQSLLHQAFNGDL